MAASVKPSSYTYRGQFGNRNQGTHFNVDSRTGGVSFRLPIPTSPGRGGFGPSLELVHDSGSAGSNGVFGAGWNLSGVQSIRRKTSVMIPVYDDDEDTFVHSIAGDLVPVIRGDRHPVEWDDTWDGTRCRVRLYQPRVESQPLRVERWESSDGSGIQFWKAIESGNVATVFGKDAGSRIARCGGNGEKERIFAWLVAEVRDGFGNQMVFTYKGESPDALAANASPWAFEVVFDYGEHSGESPTTREDQAGWNMRPDPFSVYKSGFEIRTYRRCERVLMFHHFAELGRQDSLVAATELSYGLNSKSGVSVLESCVQCGYQLGKSGKLSCIRLPANQFEYWQAPDIASASVEEFELGLTGLTTPDVQWVDLNGDGAPGVLVKSPGGGWYYHSNKSDDAKPAVGDPSLVSYVPVFAESSEWSFEDLSGDGKLDFVFLSPSSNVVGFHERSNHETWSDFVPMQSYPTDSFIRDSPIQKLDMTGNGLADMLQLTAQRGNELSWYPALGRLGYGREKRTVGAPHVPTRDETVAIVVCDMTGDGLSDLVSIRNNHVCYWPNMGHGRFSSCVVMKSPPFLADKSDFNPLRVRVADITGSGTADLIYLPPEGGVRIYYNRAGNAWSDAHVRSAFPSLDKLCAVDVLDVSGRGTQCLVWTSDHPGYRSGTGLTTVRFIDLMGGCQPGVLTKCTNGIGGEVYMSYRSSTHYHLDDQRAGRPWTTRLPFPITCVERVVTKDVIAETSCTMRYAYHNGSYDPKERQFCGFQIVDEWDAQELSGLSTHKFCRPPVHTKTWFHIGLEELDREAILPGCFSTDIPQQRPLPVAGVSSELSLEGMTREEIQDAYRALAGCQRRQEVFGDDGSSKAAVPYVVTQHQYEVVMRQKIHPGQRYGRFRVNTQEELALHYEREPREAAAQHTVTIETDCFGNARKQAVVNYGKADSKLSRDVDKQRQQETFILYTETDYTNAIDPFTTPGPNPAENFQAPVPSETRKYRVLPGSTWACGSALDRYPRDGLVALLPGAGEIPFYNHSATPTPSDKGLRKLISKARTLYSKGDHTGKLPLHTLEPLSVEYQSYQLAFSRQLLEATLKDDDSKPLLSTTELENELRAGGFVQLDQSNEWWAPSARKVFSDSPARETGLGSSSLSAARSHFYMPNAEIDPFGNLTYQEMDRHRLLPVKSVNAIGSEVCFVNDYIHLQPALVTDPNGNRTRTAFDAFGRPVGIAVMGKATEAVSDSFDGFSVAVSPENLDHFIKDPSGPVAAQLLGRAGRRTIYLDSCRWDTDYGHRRAMPSFVAELVRDTHYQDPAGPAQIAVQITYLDGHGEAIQQVSLSENSDETKKWQFGGWAIRDNKRQPVKQFLPFTGASHDFRPQADSVSAPATTLLRDPLDRVVAVLNADHTWRKTRLSPWAQVDFDEGDTIGIDDPATDQDVGAYFATLNRDSYFPTWKNLEDNASSRHAVAKSEAYHDTPTTAHKDALGREMVVEVDNGRLESGRDIRATRVEYDPNGDKVAELRDALDRVVAATRYDLLGELLHTRSMDSGSRWFLPDCLGASFLSWSSRGDRKRVVYDKLRRVEQGWLRLPPASSTEIMIMKNTYGEGEADAREKNLVGQLYQCHDQSGLRTNRRFDFHGNCIESCVRYAVEYKQTLDWSREDIKLEDTSYSSKAAFNAIGREVHVEDFNGESVRRTYDVANRLRTLKSLAKDGSTIASVNKIEYSEDGKTILVEHGNGSRTTHDFDKKTRRLAKTCTKRIKDGAILGDLTYTRDCLGRVVCKDNRAQKIVHFDNNAVTPSQEFRYDALGQLLEATGREQAGASKEGQKQLRPHAAFSGREDSVPGDGRRMVEYVETYKYDLAGNMVQMQHAPRKADSYSGWTRTYTYQEPSRVDPEVKSNRLSSTAIGKVTETYGYDDNAGRNGCITSVPGYSTLTWDHDDRLRSFSTQRISADGSATPETTWYVYDAQGERVRKITDRSAASGSPPRRSKETRYLPMRDVYTRFGGDGSSVVRTITTANVGDGDLGERPIALVEHDSSTEQQVIRYQASQHLELDDRSQVVSYEEYSPYGCSTYQARIKGAPRKYRFMQYQHDGESGLYLCSARYYAPWLGRWMSPDPLGTADGLNVYAYVSNDPVNFDDLEGTMMRNKANTGGGASGAEAPGSPVTFIERPQASQVGLSRRQIAEAKLNRNIVYDQVRMPLGMIRFSQNSVSPKLHNPDTGGLISIEQQVGNLQAAVQQLQDSKLSEAEAQSRAATDFLAKFGQINVALVIGADTKGTGNKTAWYSTDNRRLTVLKRALPDTTEVTARLATQEELLGMVQLGPPRPDMGPAAAAAQNQRRERFDNLYSNLIGQPFDPKSAGALKLTAFINEKRSKWSTKNDGIEIAITGGNGQNRGHASRNRGQAFRR
ncbi:65kDa B protein-domain-containing protein [Xylaria acuta]|nr:65kDa B protein-domain-containing protein [Xylaria acuta]